MFVMSFPFNALSGISISVFCRGSMDGGFGKFRNVPLILWILNCILPRLFNSFGEIFVFEVSPKVRLKRFYSLIGSISVYV